VKRLLLLPVLATIACGKSGDSANAGDTAVDSAAAMAESPREVRDTTALTCGVTGTPALEDTGIGELKQGRSIDEIPALCEVLSDSEQQGQEGMMERVVVVQIAGETVRAVVDRGRISRIEVNTPRFRTADSLGVDTPLSRIAAMRGAQFAPGHDGVFGFSPEHCGLSFRFSVPWRPPAGGQWTAQAITARHGTAAVNRVIVIPCRR